MSSTPINLQSFTRLHRFAVLRELIRKWWRLELFLIDGAGEPVPQDGTPTDLSRPIAAENDFCRLSLHAALGARRCAESLRVTLNKLRDAGRNAQVVSHECHLGFVILGCGLYLSGELCGAAVVSGLSLEPLRSFAEAQLLRKLNEAVPAAGQGTDLERALRRVPIYSQIETEQLCDLLKLCVTEISAHFDTLGKNEEADIPSTPLFLGTSAPAQTLARRIDQLRHSTVSVLIIGEPGVGKERIGRAIAPNSPFLVQPCGLPEESLMVDLFGDGERKGRLDLAKGGTLYLDDVGAMPQVVQTRLLHELRTGKNLPRLLSAHLTDLAPATVTGDFSAELLRHIGAVSLWVPPLREHSDDVPLYCAQILNDREARSAQRPQRLSPEVLAALMNYGWPGNLRELAGEVLLLMTLSGDVEEIPAALLPPRFKRPRGIP